MVYRPPKHQASKQVKVQVTFTFRSQRESFKRHIQICAENTDWYEHPVNSEEPLQMIGIFHGYRAANRGDGWLVGLAQDVVAEATGSWGTTYAVDPTNMPGNVKSVLGGGKRSRALVAAGLTVMPKSRALNRRVVGLPKPSQLELAFGVGGAYLRSNNLLHEVVVRSHQLPQLQLMAALGPRAGYLPISVGPFRPEFAKQVRDELRQVAFVAVRDEKSLSELAGLPNVHRIPDLAACSIGRTKPELEAGEPGVVAIAVRSLKGTNIGLEVGERLEARKLKVRFGVQSSVGRTNDDTGLYSDAGLHAESFEELLATGPRPSVVIAGRLHAALYAISQGYPTIHLGYERKSWGAYRDLNLEPWVVNSWKTEAGEVERLVDDLLADPSEYWSRLQGQFSHLEGGWNKLTSLIKQMDGNQIDAGSPVASPVLNEEGGLLPR